MLCLGAEALSLRPNGELGDAEDYVNCSGDLGEGGWGRLRCVLSTAPTAPSRAPGPPRHPAGVRWLPAPDTLPFAVDLGGVAVTGVGDPYVASLQPGAFGREELLARHQACLQFLVLDVLASSFVVEDLDLHG